MIKSGTRREIVETETMPKGAPKNYRLTLAAKEDLINIARYGDANFGIEASNRFRTKLEARFQELAEHPMRYSEVNYIREGYRRSVFGVHSIYYVPDDDGVLIVRVLGRQDPKRALRS